MILLLIKLLLILSTLILGWIIFYPLVICIYFKLKYGKLVVVKYFPIIGMYRYFMQGLKYHKDIIHFKREVAYSNPDAELIVTNLFEKPYLLFLKPKQAKELLFNHQNCKKRDDQLFGDITSQKGLVFVVGQEWKDQRKLLSDFFTFEKLFGKIPVMKELIKETLVFEKDQRVPIIEECAKIASRVMQITFFSQDDNTLFNGVHISKLMVEFAGKLMMITYGSVWHRIRSFFGFKGESTMPKWLLTNEEKLILNNINMLRQYVSQLIEDKFQIQKNEKNNDDVIEILFQNNKGNSLDPELKELIIHQYITFVFAGTDTTSHMAGMSIYMLGKYQNIQQQLREELIKNNITFDSVQGFDLSKLKLLNAFVNECLRLVLPTDGLIPRIAINNQFIEKYYVRKGFYVDVAIQPMVTHPQFFDDPQNMNLNRWLNNENNEAFIPFSSGGRNCLGQHLAKLEIKLILIFVLLKYNMEIDEKTQLVMNYGFLYEPEDDRLIKFNKL